MSAYIYNNNSKQRILTKFDCPNCGWEPPKHSYFVNLKETKNEVMQFNDMCLNEGEKINVIFPIILRTNNIKTELGSFCE